LGSRPGRAVRSAEHAILSELEGEAYGGRQQPRHHPLVHEGGGEPAVLALDAKAFVERLRFEAYLRRPDDPPNLEESAVGWITILGHDASISATAHVNLRRGDASADDPSEGCSKL